MNELWDAFKEIFGLKRCNGYVFHEWKDTGKPSDGVTIEKRCQRCGLTADFFYPHY